MICDLQHFAQNESYSIRFVLPVPNSERDSTIAYRYYHSTRHEYSKIIMARLLLLSMSGQDTICSHQSTIVVHSGPDRSCCMSLLYLGRVVLGVNSIVQPQDNGEFCTMQRKVLSMSCTSSCGFLEARKRLVSTYICRPNVLGPDHSSQTNGGLHVI
jgi:hypothetical protein